MIRWVFFILFILYLPVSAESILKSKELIVDNDGIVYRSNSLQINGASPNYRLNVKGDFQIQGRFDLHEEDPAIHFPDTGWSIEYGEPVSASARTLAILNRSDGEVAVTRSFFINDEGRLGVGVSAPQEALEFDRSFTRLEMGVDGRIEWPDDLADTNDDYYFISFIPSENLAGQHSLVFYATNDNSHENILFSQAEDWRLDLIHKKVVVNASSFSVLSDRRIKRDIEPIENALQAVLSLEGVRYNLKTDDVPSDQKQGRRMGFIAQDVESIVPEIVRKIDGRYSLGYSNLMALLVEAYKEQDQRLQQLLEDISKLESDRLNGAGK